MDWVYFCVFGKLKGTERDFVECMRNGNECFRFKGYFWLLTFDIAIGVHGINTCIQNKRVHGSCFHVSSYVI